MAGRVGLRASALEDADVGVGCAGDFGDEDDDVLRSAEGGGIFAPNGGDVARGIGRVEWAVAPGSSLGAAEREGEEPISVEGEGCMGGAELYEFVGGGFDEAVDLGVNDGG